MQIMNAYIPNQDDGTVSVINTDTNTVSTTITVGSGPVGVAVTPDGTQAYVTNGGSGTVSVIDTATNTVSTSITVGSNPIGVAVTPNGAYAYVANFNDGTVSVINTATNTVSTTITGLPSDPLAVGITPNGTQAWVSGTSGPGITIIDIATNTRSTSVSVGVIRSIAFTPDGTLAYAINNGGSAISVINTNTLDVSTFAISSSFVAVAVAFSADGQLAYISSANNTNPGAVSVVSTGTQTVSDTITVGVVPYGLAITPDGGTLYVANNNSGTVSVINTASLSVIDTITVGNQPKALGLFIQPSAGENMAGYVNMFHNPTFDVAQRGTSGTVVTSTGGASAYTLDGWILGGTSSSGSPTLAWAQTTSAITPGTFGAISITGNTNVSDAYIKQRIESTIAKDIAGVQVTFQATITNNTGASLTPKLTVKHAGSTDSWSSPVTDLSAESLQAIASGTTATVAYSFATNASSTNGLEFTLDFGSSLNSNSKSVIVTGCDVRYTPSSPTGLIPSPALFEARPVGVELAYCQRYFYEISSASPANPYTTFGVGGTASSTVAYIFVNFPQVMRAIPSFTSSAYSTFGDNLGSITSITALALLDAFSESASLDVTGTASGAGKAVMLGAADTASAYMQFSAEL
jgi:YVTN family beta-propeller protein